MLRKCQLMNTHMPLATVGCQSNTDTSGVLTRNQADMHLCKHDTEHSKRAGQAHVLYEALDDMSRKGAHAKDTVGEDCERTTLVPSSIAPSWQRWARICAKRKWPTTPTKGP